MKWFKHETSAIKDDKIRMAIQMSGTFKIYGLYFVLCEICAEKIKPGRVDPTVEITFQYLKELTQIYHMKKLVKMLSILNNLQLISVQSPDNLDSIYAQSTFNLPTFFHKVISISVPNLLKRLDNHTRNLQVTDQQLAPKNKIKNKIKDKDINTPLTPQGVNDDHFNFFWKSYPKKTGKKLALKSWKKINPSAELREKIMNAISVQQSWPQWNRDDGQYIPNPATWLNQGRWDDEYEDRRCKRCNDRGKFISATGYEIICGCPASIGKS